MVLGFIQGIFTNTIFANLEKLPKHISRKVTKRIAKRLPGRSVTQNGTITRLKQRRKALDLTLYGSWGWEKTYQFTLKTYKYSPLLVKYWNYSKSSPSQQVIHGGGAASHVFKWLKSYQLRAHTPSLNTTPDINYRHTHFANQYFFEKESEFHTHSLRLVGSPVPQNLYEVSHSSLWKTKALDNESKLYNGLEAISLIRKRVSRFSRKNLNQQPLLSYITRTKLETLRSKLTKMNQHVLNRQLYQKHALFISHAKFFRRCHKRLRFNYHPTIRKYKFALISNLRKIRARSKVQVYRTRLRKLTHALPNRRSHSLHKSNDGDYLPQSYRKSFKALGVLKGRRASIARYKRRVRLFTSRNQSLRLSNLTKSSDSLQIKSPFRVKPQTGINHETSRTVIFKLEKPLWEYDNKDMSVAQAKKLMSWHTVYSAKRPLTRQRIAVEFFLKRQFISLNHQRRFLKVKNQIFTRIRRGKNYNKYMSRNRDNRTYSFNNFRQYMLRTRLVSPYTHVKERAIFKKPLSMYVHLVNQSKSSDVQKWRHSKPYAFAGNITNTAHKTTTILDSYLHNTLQSHNVFNSRTKKLQFYAMKSKSRSKQVHGALHHQPEGSKWQSISIKQNLKGLSYLRRMRARKSSLPQTKQRVYKAPIPKFKATRNYLTSSAQSFGKASGPRLQLMLLSRPQKKHSSIISKYLPTFIDLTTLNVDAGQFTRGLVMLPTRSKTLLACQKFRFHKTSFSERLSLYPQTSFRLSNYYPNTLKVHTNLVIEGVKSVYPSLTTRSSQNFTLRSPIMFLTQFFVKNTLQNIIPKFIFKKKIFSFLKPNEVRQALMNRKKQIFTYKLVFNQKVLMYKSLNFSPLKLKQLYTTLVNANLKNSQPLFAHLSQYTNRTYNLKHRLSDVLNADTFDLRGTSQLFQRLEVKIPRIRFKPGYQRMWRQSRLALKEALRVKFTYQRKLSQYITRFFRRSNYYAFSASEMSIDKVIIYSRLLPDMVTLLVFLQHRLIYLNGKYVQSKTAIIYENDLIQLIVSKWYYAAYRWITNWTLKRVKKYKRLVYRKGLAGRYKLMKQRKQRSFYTPNWIYLTKYDLSDIKPYLEVDYLTLSAIVIYNPYILGYQTPAETPHYRPTVYRLYNWKYIT